MSSALTKAQNAEPHRVLARLLFTNALGYRDAAAGLRLMHKTMDAPPNTFVLFAVLGQAYEHAFKGFLAHRGWSEARLRALGHDLLQVFAEAQAAGYIPYAGLKDELDILGPLYKSQSLRYLRDESLDLPDPPGASVELSYKSIDDLGMQLPISDLGDWD